MIKNKIFKSLSILLIYPNDEMKRDIELIANFIMDDKSFINCKYGEKFSAFIDYIKKNDLLFLQESYVSIFDRQKYFSLYLFEHIHGDSRERGMALVDLQNLYKTYNFEINSSNELPDYIPLFLEFISLISEKEAYTLLGDIINICAIMKRRLENLKSPYSLIFSVLEQLSYVKPDYNIVEKIILDDIKSKKNFNLDAEWEEKKIF